MTEAVDHLEISKLKDGGFVVWEEYDLRRDFRAPAYGCSTIEEAIAYVTKRLGPVAWSEAMTASSEKASA